MSQKIINFARLLHDWEQDWGIPAVVKSFFDNE